MKTQYKFIGQFFGILAVIGVVLAGYSYYRYTKSPEYQALKYYQEMEARYRADTYGGETPEETLQLFIDALKKGDIELASKYFVIEKQQEKFRELKTGQENNNLNKIIINLEKLTYPTKYSDGLNYDLSFVEADKTIKFGVHFVLNEATKKWKIESL